MPTGEELAEESRKREEERRKKIADKAADTLGGISGQGVSTIRSAAARRRKAIEDATN